jgi:hypothetical protein
MDMYEKSLKMFLDENKVEKKKLFWNYLSNLLMVKLTNVISWTERTVVFAGTDNDFKFPGVLQVVEYFQTTPKQEWD